MRPRYFLRDATRTVNVTINDVVIGSLLEAPPKMMGDHLTLDKSLKCDFEIDKVLKDVRVLNTLDLSIYNLSRDNRNKIQDIALGDSPKKGKKGVIVAVYAGYGDDTDLIFKGTIVTALAEYEPPNWVLKVTAKDGLSVLQSTEYSASSGRIALKSSMKSAIGAVKRALSQSQQNQAEAEDVALQNEQLELNQNGIFNSGIANEGDLLDQVKNLQETVQLMDKEAKKLEAVIDDEEMHVFLSARREKAFIVSAKTGMIGQPSIDEKGKISLEHLIRPGFKIGGKIEVDSRLGGKVHQVGRFFSQKAPNERVSGLFRIDRLKYKGSTTDVNTWTVQIEGSRLRK